MRCSPLVDGQTAARGTCYTDAILQKLKAAYNRNHPDVAPITATDPAAIHRELVARMESTCPATEDCWLQELPADQRRYVDEQVFAPDQPAEWTKNPTAWLSNLDIENVLKQYERSHPHFLFLGPTPIDFDTRVSGKCVWDDLCHFSVEGCTRRGKTHVGIIFNMDKHTGDGSHWMSMWMDLPAQRVYYFDSACNPTPPEIKRFVRRVCPNFVYDENHPNQHQRSNTECGMYSLYFIVSMLKATRPTTTWARRFKGGKIPDRAMIRLRNVYYNTNAKQSGGTPPVANNSQNGGYTPPVSIRQHSIPTNFQENNPMNTFDVNTGNNGNQVENTPIPASQIVGEATRAVRDAIDQQNGRLNLAARAAIQAVRNLPERQQTGRLSGMATMAQGAALGALNSARGASTGLSRMATRVRGEASEALTSAQGAARDVALGAQGAARDVALGAQGAARDVALGALNSAQGAALGALNSAQGAVRDVALGAQGAVRDVALGAQGAVRGAVQGASTRLSGMRENRARNAADQSAQEAIASLLKVRNDVDQSARKAVLSLVGSVQNRLNTVASKATQSVVKLVEDRNTTFNELRSIAEQAVRSIAEKEVENAKKKYTPFTVAADMAMKAFSSAFAYIQKTFGDLFKPVPPRNATVIMGLTPYLIYDNKNSPTRYRPYIRSYSPAPAGWTGFIENVDDDLMRIITGVEKERGPPDYIEKRIEMEVPVSSRMVNPKDNPLLLPGTKTRSVNQPLKIIPPSPGSFIPRPGSPASIFSNRNRSLDEHDM
jgi:hypothetical protein